MSKPRIVARHELTPVQDMRLCDSQMAYSGPGVTVQVSFDLLDDDAALKALDAAVADVRAQIDEVRFRKAGD